MFYVFVRDALLRLSGARSAPIPLLCATSDSALRKGRARTEYLRGVVYPGPQGWRVRTTGAQGSGILRSMSEANCLIVLEHERGDVAAGEVVNALPLYGLV
jgi:molybdopterin molybdotransferase